MATKKQPIPHDAETTKAAKPQKTVAVQKLRQEDKEKLVQDAVKVIVPLWFGNPSVSIRDAVNGKQLRPESALCLLIHGANVGVKGHSSITACEFALLPFGLDRFDANYIAFQGTMSLHGAKLVKFVNEPKEDADEEDEEEDEEAAPIVLTKKGQELFDFAKDAILEG